MKTLVLLIVLLVTTWLVVRYVKDVEPILPKLKTTADHTTRNRLETHTQELRTFTAQNPTYSTEIAFLIDMKIPSGKNRFFIYSLKEDKVVDAGLVAHGSGSETGIEGNLRFSNVNKSYCSSLGKYYVGKSYTGQFGKAYKLYGLDSTNSNAYSRNIVLHRYWQVPFEEQNDPIMHSLGCPMVNDLYFNRIDSVLGHSKKKIILYIYY